MKRRDNQRQKEARRRVGTFRLPATLCQSAPARENYAEIEAKLGTGAKSRMIVRSRGRKKGLQASPPSTAHINSQFTINV